MTPRDSEAGSEAGLTLLPAVDVAGGKAVRLVQGAAGTETDYGEPLQAALAWQAAGAQWLHLVDLDAAFGRGSNAGLLASVVGRLDVAVELSGGIRDDASLAAALSTGCARVTLARGNEPWPDGTCDLRVRRQAASSGAAWMTRIRLFPGTPA